jgi:hypothetical protein
MTRFTDLPPSTFGTPSLVSHRQHADPPWLWGGAAVGSLLINLIGVGVFGRLLLPDSPPQTVATAAQTSPVRVSLYSAKLRAKPVSAPRTTVPPKVASQESATGSLASSSSVALSLASAIPAARGHSGTVGAAAVVPAHVAETPTQSSYLPTSPSPHRSTLPVGSKTGANLSAQPLNQPQPSGPVQSGLLLPGVPAVPDPRRNHPGEDRRWQQPVQSFAEQHGLPAQFMAQIQVVAANPAEATAELVENQVSAPMLDAAVDGENSPGLSGEEAALQVYPATIQGKPSKMLSSDPAACLLTPPALQSFGQPVIVQVAIDAAGNQTIAAPPRSGNNSYDQLALCALKTWSFNPAYEQRSETKSYRASYLSIKITINES